MRFQRVIEQVFYRPWFIAPESHAAIARLINSKLARSEGGGDDDPFGLSSFIVQRPQMQVDPAGIAHVWVFGALGQGLSSLEKSCGNTDYEDLVSEIESAASAKGLFLHVDSGGGMCSGCIEAASVIADYPVPSVAFAAGMMCSAAYACAVGCDRVYSTASAMVGSIGTLCPWVDASVAWEMEGMRFAPIVSGGADLKSTMHGPSITPAQTEHLQQISDDYAGQFIAHVQKFRTPDDEVYRGGGYVGSRALDYGLVDALMPNEQQAYAELLNLIHG